MDIQKIKNKIIKNSKIDTDYLMEFNERNIMKELSVTQYARECGCSRTNIIKKIQRDTLCHKFKKIGNQYVIYATIKK